MSKKTADKSGVWGFIGRGIGLTAAIVTIATIGWCLSIWYHNLNDKITTIHSTALLNEMTIANKSLRDRVEALTEDNNQLMSIIDNYEIKPTEKDWLDINDRCIEMYSIIVKCVHLQHKKYAALQPQYIEHVDKWVSITNNITKVNWLTDKSKIDEFNKEIKDMSEEFVVIVSDMISVSKDIADMLAMQKIQFQNYMSGAGLIHVVKQDDQSYVVLNKYPYKGVNWDTGDIKVFDIPVYNQYMDSVSSTKPSK
ncbi:MAG: hypothetical protein GXY44_09635 [Phycisphaerales bacterium]|nr:hypothetical protein [Phycisphaerales bacterium]